MEEAMKDDEGKRQWDLLPWAELEQVVGVFTYGAERYGESNWRQGFRYGRLWNAIMRHMVAFKMGENTDSSGHHHLAHAAAGMLMLLAHHNERLGKDDRKRGEGITTTGLNGDLQIGVESSPGHSLRAVENS